MKYLFTLCCLLCSATLFATVHTVDNGANATADYTDLQEAIDEATEGDTLLIKGSYTPYGRRRYIFNDNVQSDGIIVDKRLVFIGQGAHGHPNGPGFFDRLRKTHLGYLVLTSTSETSASGSVFIGVRTFAVFFGLYNSAAQTIENVEFRDSNIDRLYVGNEEQSVDGLIVRRSVLAVSSGSSPQSFGSKAKNVKVYNSILDIPGALRMLEGDNVFVNNIVSVRPAGAFVQYGENSENEALFEKQWSIENVKFQNSILFVEGLQDSRTEVRIAILSSNSELVNSILMNPFVTRGLLDVGNVDVVLSNMSVEREPFMRIPSQEDTENHWIRANTAIGDYHLIETSVGKQGGTDNTDIGLYGGESPWIDGPVWRYSNEPSIPVVESLKLEKKTVKPGESLKVRVRARAKGNQ